MKLNKSSRMALFVLLSLSLTSCLSGVGSTKVKSLTSAFSNSTTPSTADSFSVTLAYRKDSSPDDARLVQIQGNRTVASANFVNTCGATGSSCSCKFYISTSDTSPAGTSAISISEDSNSISCEISGAVDPDNYTHVRLFNTDETKSTGFIPIQTSLSLDDVLGSLDDKKVRKILRYSCKRTFFEGTTVTANSIVCSTDLDDLGLITATYNYYLYSSTESNNLADKGSDVAFESAICGNSSFLQTQCSATTSTQYGLYGEAAGPFAVKISYAAKPDGEAAVPTEGYAALPDSSGECPLGLVKIRPWVAQPPSITAGSLGTNPPSNFINTANTLNNTIVELATITPSPFTVYRAPSSGGCHDIDPSANITWDCSNASFGAEYAATTTNYLGYSPVVCAIDKDMLTGL